MSSAHFTKADENPFYTMLNFPYASNFFGRQGLVDEIWQGVSSVEPHSFAISGIPKIGKTRLLFYLREKFYSQTIETGGPVHFIYASFLNVTEKGQFLPTFCGKLMREKDRAFDSRRSATIRLLPSRDLDRDSIKKKLDDLFQELKESNERLVLCMDDFDSAYQALDVEDELILTEISQAHPLIIVTQQRLSSTRHLSPDQRGASLLLAKLQRREIGPLTEGEALELLTDPLKDRLPFSDEEKTMLIEEAGTHPFLLTQAGRALYTTLLDFQRPVEKDMQRHQKQRFHTLLAGAQEVEDWLNQIWNGLSVGERDVLYQMYSRESTVADFALETADLLALESKGLIHHKQGAYSLCCKLLRKYLDANFFIHDIRSKLAPLDERVFDYLYRHAGELCPKEALRQDVWGDALDAQSDGELEEGSGDADGNEPRKKNIYRGLEAALRRIREVMKERNPHHEYIENIHGRGYIFHLKGISPEKP